MRKRTINCFFDSFFWFLIYSLPVIAVVLQLATGHADISLSGAMSYLGLDVFNNNLIYVSLNSIFGLNGIFPLFASTDLLLFFSYFICVWICHLIVDVLLFLIRWSHDLISSFGGEK